jgi:hypothetical protein
MILKHFKNSIYFVEQDNSKLSKQKTYFKNIH